MAAAAPPVVSVTAATGTAWCTQMQPSANATRTSAVDISCGCMPVPRKPRNADDVFARATRACAASTQAGRRTSCGACTCGVPVAVLAAVYLLQVGSLRSIGDYHLQPGRSRAQSGTLQQLQAARASDAHGGPAGARARATARGASRLSLELATRTRTCTRSDGHGTAVQLSCARDRLTSWCHCQLFRGGGVISQSARRPRPDHVPSNCGYFRYPEHITEVVHVAARKGAAEGTSGRELLGPSSESSCSPWALQMREVPAADGIQLISIAHARVGSPGASRPVHMTRARAIPRGALVEHFTWCTAAPEEPTGHGQWVHHDGRTRTTG